ncbi:MAG: hypothetical protein K2Q01_12305, partial [Rickettsiales bacterium]|nr:hypothetical protein [Rickettsiales bacterium]
MNITVFTSNQPRHCRFIHALSTICDTLHVVQESTTLFPGKVKGSIYTQSPLMAEYFSHVARAEAEVFGDIAPCPANARVTGLSMGDIQHVGPERLGEALNSDI